MTHRSLLTDTTHNGEDYVIRVSDWIGTIGSLGGGACADLIAGAVQYDALANNRDSSVVILTGCLRSRARIHDSCGRRALGIIRLVVSDQMPYGQVVDEDGIGKGSIKVHYLMPESATLRAIARARADKGRLERTAAYLESKRKRAAARDVRRLIGELP